MAGAQGLAQLPLQGNGQTRIPLIPAKAGIQEHGKPRMSLWIPAFAGMNGDRLFAVLEPNLRERG